MTAGTLCLVAALPLMAQTNRPLSPDGVASAHVQGEWVKPERATAAMGGERYEGGRRIDITYGRPLYGGAAVARGRESLDAARDRGPARHRRHRSWT